MQELHLCLLLDSCPFCFRHSCLQIPIRVVYLDRSMAAFAGAASEDAAAVNHHDFVPEAMQKTSAAVQPCVHLLYRPGHYDILYPKAAVQMQQ